MPPMPNARITSTQFQRHLDKAQQLALDSITAFALFYFLRCFLRIPDQKTKYTQVFKKHKKVLSLLPPAVFSMLILSLHKLLDESHNPVSISRCVSMALELSLISRDTQRYLKSRIKSVRPMWDKVDELRNSLIAHRDCGIPVKKVFEDARISPKDLREFALAYWEVLNALRSASGKSPFDADLCCKLLLRDLESFMTDLLYAVASPQAPQP